LFDVILLHCLTENKFVKVPDEILIRNAYNLNVNHISSICDIPTLTKKNHWPGIIIHVIQIL